MTRRSLQWSIHGVRVRVESELALPEALLFPMRRHEVTPDGQAAQLDMAISRAALPRRAFDGTPMSLVYGRTRMTCVFGRDDYRLRLDRGGVSGSIAAGSMRVFAPSAAWLRDALTCRALIPVALAHHLAGFGLFHVHAACVVDAEQRGWLLAGPSGAGKSTVAYALLQRGWRLVADDGILLRRQGDDVVASPFRDEFHLTAEAAAAFGGVEWLRPPGRNAAKGVVAVREPSRTGMARLARAVQLVVAGKDGHPPRSVTRPMPSRAAYLKGLIEDNPLVFLRDARTHLALLTRLVERCELRCIIGGRDLLGDAAGRLEQLFGVPESR